MCSSVHFSQLQQYQQYHLIYVSFRFEYTYTIMCFILILARVSSFHSNYYQLCLYWTANNEKMTVNIGCIRLEMKHGLALALIIHWLYIMCSFCHP